MRVDLKGEDDFYIKAPAKQLAGDAIQLVECFTSLHETLDSNLLWQLLLVVNLIHLKLTKSPKVKAYLRVISVNLKLEDLIIMWFSEVGGMIVNDTSNPCLYSIVNPAMPSAGIQKGSSFQFALCLFALC